MRTANVPCPRVYACAESIDSADHFPPPSSMRTGTRTASLRGAVVCEAGGQDLQIDRYISVVGRASFWYALPHPLSP
eukprot:5824194-Prymnesium_polylepis.1